MNLDVPSELLPFSTTGNSDRRINDRVNNTASEMSAIDKSTLI